MTLTLEFTSETVAPRVDAFNLCQEADGRRTLTSVTFSIEAGEVVGIAGGSGAGKTTLLEALAETRPARTGQVLVDGNPVESTATGLAFGYVPQDDIIHLELPLRRTLEHAAGLRMPKHTSTETRDRAVTRVLDQLDLSDRADVVVRSLSGGQRKRASIAVELLTDPGLFFLDEPTSGLDPATSARVMEQLRSLAKSATVVLTTHAPADLAKCDRIIFLASGGRVVFAGTPDQARRHFDVHDLAAVYEILEASESDIPRIAAPSTTDAPQPRASSRTEPSNRRPGRLQQWRALTNRTVDLMFRNKLTLSILLGSPVMIIAMMGVLFSPGAFGADQPSAMPAIQTLFWVTFSSFFFGVTYGLLQIVGERAIVRREQLSGLSLTAYVASKVAVLGPLLVGVNVAMLGVLRLLDRLPAVGLADSVTAVAAGTFISLAGLSLGLVASASVQNPAQATLALPMLCFPQVLFAGASIATADMTLVGRIMSFAMANRWGFESMGRTLELDTLIGDNPSAASYLETFSGSAMTGPVVLAAITVTMLAMTVRVLRRQTTDR